MVGLIQKILMDLLASTTDEATINEIKQLAGLPLDHVYQINNVYSDEEWQKLFAATMTVLKLTPQQIDDLYADFFLKDVQKRFPVWFNMAKNSQEFLKIQPTIHNCFATSVADQKTRDAINDKFKIESFPQKIIVHYRSDNHHCGLYKSLAKRVIEHYKDQATIEEPRCSKEGHDECEIHVQWSILNQAASTEAPSTT